MDSLNFILCLSQCVGPAMQCWAAVQNPLLIPQFSFCLCASVVWNQIAELQQKLLNIFLGVTRKEYSHMKTLYCRLNVGFVSKPLVQKEENAEIRVLKKIFFG